jgi:pimeloyl-ACP methyl ester carboxylesterase
MQNQTAGTRHNVNIRTAPVAYWEYVNTSDELRGSSIPVVLVHGFRGDHHGLELIATQINSSRVIVPDLPGFGQSPRLALENQPVSHTLNNLGEWLTAFCDTVVDSPFILVGHSFGTLVVADSLRHGCAPRELVLINPISSPALSGPRGVLSQLALMYYRIARLIPERLGNALLSNRGIVRLMSETMAKTEDMHLRAWIHEQHDRHFSTFTDRESLDEAFSASISHTVHEYASAFTSPTVIIAAERDDITPLAEQLRLAHEMPDAQLVIVENVGHLVHYEAPNLVSEIVNHRLKDLDATHSKQRT